MARRSLAVAAIAAAFVAWGRPALGADREACFSSAESAQTLRAQGHLHLAHDKLLVCAQQGCPAAVQSDCTKWLGEVTAEVPTIVVQVHDAAGNDLSDVSVVVDGVIVAERLDGRPIELDAGPHALRLERTGSTTVERSLILVAGQKGRVVEAQLEAAAAVASAGATAQPGARPSIWEGISTPVWILGGVGAAGLVSTAVFWAWGRSEYSSLQGSCSPACDPSSVSGVRTKLVVGDVSLGVAVVALGAGAWVYLTGRGNDGQKPATEGAKLVVAPEPGGGVVGLGGRF